MLSTVFIGNDDEIEHRFPFFEEALGKKNVISLALNTLPNNTYAEPFSNFTNHNHIFVLSAQASKNEQLTLYLIKNAKKLFFDFTEPIPLSLIDKYKKYKSEAGTKIGVNILPWLALNTEISNHNENQHIQITSLSPEKPMISEIFNYLIFITEELQCDNIKCKFHIIGNTNKEATIIVADAFNLNGKYIHLTIGESSERQHKISCYRENEIIRKDIIDTTLFKKPNLIIQQLNELANNIEYSNLNSATVVMKLYEKLKTVAEKRGISINEH